ncbi:hypothetical protein DYD21_20635 [Rhodohalobacter sp. SW132]|uniref:hypothetical protein n=1 Tax=Rhodohalobacter sp. SW132 TaxID=2293433 RepID=UPI000E227C59|nr:hypothetical protein [Rhodohalobacter sp. SW132]REL23936.1 hypothetical protein DYD21_20635 [Rhodohalobacter sp. SW132]
MVAGIKSTIISFEEFYLVKGDVSATHRKSTGVRSFEWRKLVQVLEQKYIAYHHLSLCSFLLAQKRTKKGANE